MRLILISACLLASVLSDNATRPLHSSQPLQRPAQRGYTTRQRTGPVVAHGVPAGYAGPVGSGGFAGAAPGGGFAGGAPVGFVSGGQGFSSASDFNPLLDGGVRGYPGIKARINQRGFQYFSSLIAPILDQEIKRAHIPPINQCIPQVSGCIQVYNLYVSRYRCPQRVVIYPAPPNQVVIAVQNLDVGVTGNLGGQINIILPLKLFGIVQVNAHQVSITVQLAISRGPTGAPYVQVVGCQASVGYLDAYIENGGLIGDIANSQFRGQISNQVRQMIPGQLCAQIPGIVNSKINGQLGGLPQSIALTQILQVAGGALGIGGGGSSGGVSSAGGCGAAPAPNAPCHAAQKTPVVSQPLPPPTAAIVANPRQVQPLPPAPQPPVQLSVPPPKSSGPSPPRASVSNTPPAPTYVPAPPTAKALPHSSNPYSKRHIVASGSTQYINHPISNSHFINSASSNVVPRVANRFVRDTRPRAQAPPSTAAVVVARGAATGFAGPVGGSNSGSSSGSSGIAFVQPGEPSPCEGCPGANTNSDPLSQIQEITKYLDLSKLSDIYLTVQLLQTSATTNDYTIDLNGEFSQGGQGGTPFGPFPMQLPYPVGNKMAEAMISDFTLNSLFYSLHRKGFLSVRLGPDTPKIGPLLKTTCSDDDDEGLEDHGVETDEATKLRRIRSAPRVFGVRNARQSDGGLSDLGICFGDILPIARERYPNRNIVIQVHTERAPSVILSSRNGGTAILDIVADADLFTDTNEKIGTIRVEGTFEVQIQTSGTRLTGHGEITSLHLTNPDQSLGLSQEALDNLGNLGKELVGKAANDVLQRGIPIQIPSGAGGLPLNFVAPNFHILEHAIYLESDFTISPSFIAQLTGGSGGGGGGICRR